MGSKEGTRPTQHPREFTLAGWSAETLAATGDKGSRQRRLAVSYLALGLPALVVSAFFSITLWDGSVELAPIIVLGVLALLAQYFPVRVSYANVSLGVGFLLAACLLGGAAVGAACVGTVFLVWSVTRDVLPWYGFRRRQPMLIRVARCLFSSGVGALGYLTATSFATWVFHLTYPISKVTTESVCGVVVIAGGVYLLQNVFSLFVSLAVGEDIAGQLRTVIPIPVLAEFLALPAALLLAVTQVSLDTASFSVLAWLYLMAAFLGWRSWQDREALKHRFEDLQLLHEAGAQVSSTLDLGELIQRFQQSLRKVVEFEMLLIKLEDEMESQARHFVFDGAGQRSELTAEALKALKELSEPPRRSQGLVVGSGEKTMYIRTLEVSESAHVRIRLDFSPEKVPSSSRRILLDALCQHTATALSNARLYRLAHVDPLTGVAIRRFFGIALRQTAVRGVDFAVIMLDLDWFKQVNDTFGHRAGDEVLRDLAVVLQGSLRVMDVVARYGGEEFVVLLPESSSLEAAAAAERIRRTLEQRHLQIDGHEITYTASFGVAGSSDVSIVNDPMEIVWKADAALLLAKRSGRNQVVTFAALKES